MKYNITKNLFLILMAFFCISCATAKYNKTTTGEPTAFGPVQQEKPGFLKRTWRKMNYFYDPNWSTTKKVAYVIGPGH
jgi:hypothetical protein